MRNTTAVRFADFHAANPKFYTLFKRFTFEAMQKGHKHLSAQMIFHRIRWETGLETRSADFADGRRLKITNDYSPYYARLFMEDNPLCEGFFRLKPIKSAPVELKTATG